MADRSWTWRRLAWLPVGLMLALWRLLWLVVHLLHGMGLIWLRFGRLSAAGRQALVQWWSARLLRLIGVRLTVSGAPREGASLLLANHVSWLDIATLHAACGRARFVSKADVLAWPLLGWLIRHVGTLFIERERKRDALRVVHEVAACLQRGDTIAVFPEGTTGPGDRVLPFHANLLQAAIAVAAPIQLAVLRYSEPGMTLSTAAQYIDDTTLIQSIWRVISARGLAVELRFLSSHATAHADRRALAEHMRGEIQQELDRMS
jgi:1-acyl-sn-glycerol-3-phosphate acyltransferase